MHNFKSILIVEDDPNTGFLVKKHLVREGFDVCLCDNGEAGLKAFKQQNFSLCILDVMLPTKDGLELSKDIHSLDPEMPFIFLTARNLKSDKISGYKNGCDDYVTKPFDIDELVFKIRAILKRSSKISSSNQKISVSDLTLLKDERLLVSKDKSVSVSHKEFLLLELFFTNSNTVIPRSNLLLRCWGNDDYFSSKILDVYLTKIRKVLKMDNKLKLQNIHGHGYKLVTPAAS